ncbi:uncharacterized protein LOC135819430 [Sycon ciliatum]|uniref:uncharacterized protein LOC135819430 n=1 Tax=Sycon ciliatum TaxID=27933 RepID=UPI0031F69CC9
MANEQAGVRSSPPECQENCVFCQSNGESGAAASQLKILKCLHVSCKSCAEQFLRYDNTIRCARCQIVTPDPGPGRKLTECLVSWPTRLSSASQDRVVHGEVQNVSDPMGCGEKLLCQNSDCEDAEEPAAMRCVTCDLLLCEQHSAIHTRHRKRKNHSLAEVPVLKRTRKSLVSRFESERCPLHNEDLLFYCKSCNTLMCDRCHANHQWAAHMHHEVVEIAAAAKDIRKSQDSRQLVSSTLHERVTSVEASIVAVNAQTKAISEKINADVAAAVKVIEDNGEAFRATLDEQRWRALKQLEEMKSAREEELRKHNIAIYLSRHMPDAAVLQVLSDDHEQYASSNSRDGSEDDSDHNAPTPSTGSSGEYAEPTGFDLGIDYSPEMERAARLFSWSSRQIPDRTVGFLPTARGYVDHSFDHDVMSPDIDLYSNGKIAKRQTRLDTTWGSVCAIAPPCEFSVKVLTGCAFLGFASLDVPAMSGVRWAHGIGDFYGWSPRECLPDNHPVYAGGMLGQPWQDDDVISLTLDTVEHTATAVHEPTGAKETIKIDEGAFPVCFRAELYGGAAIQLLPIEVNV